MFKELKWSLKRAFVLDISRRTRKNPYTKNEEEYAVIKITFDDPFDTFRLVRGMQKKRKEISLMSFKREIYDRVQVEDRHSFKGFVSFGYGNTYLVIEKAFDSLGFDVETEESICFTNLPS